MGGSVAAGLRRARVARPRRRPRPDTIEQAITRGIIDEGVLVRGAEITFMAVPVLAVADQVKRALAETEGVVTDIGSVKAPDQP